MSTNIASRNSKTVYTTKPRHNHTAARAAWEMIERSTGKQITSLRLERGSWKVTFHDNMSGSFNHTPELTRQGVRRARAEERLRKAIEIEKAENNELWDKAIAAELGAGTNDHTLESVH